MARTIILGYINGRPIYHTEEDKSPTCRSDFGKGTVDFNRLNNDTYKSNNGQYSNYYSYR